MCLSLSLDVERIPQNGGVGNDFTSGFSKLGILWNNDDEGASERTRTGKDQGVARVSCH